MIRDGCIRPGCEGVHAARGLCKKHHSSWLRSGADPSMALPPLPKGSRSKCPPTVQARAVAAYRDSELSVPEVAARFGVTDRTLHRWAVKLGSSRRMAPQVRDDAEVVRLGWEGLVVASIAAKTHRAKTSVSRILRENGIPIRKPGRPPNGWLGINFARRAV